MRVHASELIFLQMQHGEEVFSTINFYKIAIELYAM